MIDIGGSHVKILATGQRTSRRFPSGSGLTPARMVTGVKALARGWAYDAVAMGYPGVVRNGRPAADPNNLGGGWTRFDYRAAFGKPVRIVNDAAMQAMGSYRTGTMLFLGLGTGLGSALIVDGSIEAMELGHLRYSKKHNYEHYLGARGCQRLGTRKWRDRVSAAVEGFYRALLPDYILVGGGNASRLKQLPPHTSRGDNSYAFLGGFRLWQQPRSRKGRHGSAR